MDRSGIGIRTTETNNEHTLERPDSERRKTLRSSRLSGLHQLLPVPSFSREANGITSYTTTNHHPQQSTLSHPPIYVTYVSQGRKKGIV